MSEYKDILGNIISSDDESIKQVYATADKELDISADSRKQFYVPLMHKKRTGHVNAMTKEEWQTLL